MIGVCEKLYSSFIFFILIVYTVQNNCSTKWFPYMFSIEATLYKYNYDFLLMDFIPLNF
jgi:hypothetical protein